jgi:hypothetical protein
MIPIGLISRSGFDLLRADADEVLIDRAEFDIIESTNLFPRHDRRE